MCAHIDTVLQSEDRAVLFHQERNTVLCGSIWIFESSTFLAWMCLLLWSRNHVTQKVSAFEWEPEEVFT